MATYPLFHPSTRKGDVESIEKIVSAVYAIYKRAEMTTAFKSYEPDAILACCIKWKYNIDFQMKFDDALAFLGSHMKEYLTIKKSKGKKILVVRSMGTKDGSGESKTNSHYYIIKSLTITMIRDYNKFLAHHEKFTSSIRG